MPHDERYAVLIQSAPPVTQAGEQVDPVLLRLSGRYDPLVEDVAADVHLDAELLRAVIAVESGFNPAAVSRKGARGLMQLMPSTAKTYGASDVHDPTQNVRAGARYLRDLLNRYEDDLTLALAAYNAGEKAVERFGRHMPPFHETRAYVSRVMQIHRALHERMQRRLVPPTL